MRILEAKSRTKAKECRRIAVQGARTLSSQCVNVGHMTQGQRTVEECWSAMMWQVAKDKARQRVASLQSVRGNRQDLPVSSRFLEMKALG